MNYDKIEPANPTRDRFIVCKIYNSVVHEAKRLSYNDLNVHYAYNFRTCRNLGPCYKVRFLFEFVNQSRNKIRCKTNEECVDEDTE